MRKQEDDNRDDQREHRSGLDQIRLAVIQGVDGRSPTEIG
jgi:hypothetical protein